MNNTNEVIRNLTVVIKNCHLDFDIRKGAARSLLNLANQGDDAAVAVLPTVKTELEELLSAPAAEWATIHMRPQDALRNGS